MIPLGQLAGYATGGLKLLGGLFGKSNEDVRQERFQRFLEILAKMKNETINQTAMQTSGFLEQATANAKRRAIAQGAGSEAESYIIPAQASAAHEANTAMQKAIAPFNEERLSAEREFAGRPIPSSPLDYLAEAGKGVTDQLNFNDYLDVVRGGGMMPKDISQVPGAANPQSNMFKNKQSYKSGLDYRGGGDYLDDFFSPQVQF